MKVPQDQRLLKGIDEFNRRLFFECHETLEEIWLEDRGDDRLFYQGLIQIAAGYYKWEQGVLIGALKLWRAGLEKLDPYPSAHLGVDLAALIAAVGMDLQAVERAYERKGAAPDLNVPLISFVAGDADR